MPKPSTITTSVSQGDREELDELIASGGLTINQLSDFLSDKGYDISRSAVGRYTQDQQAVLDEIKRSQKLTQSFAQEMNDMGESQSHQVASQLLQSLITKVSMAKIGVDGSEIDPKDIAQLANAIKSLTASSKDRQAIEREAARIAREQAAESVKNVAQEKGFTDETVELLQQRILQGV